MARILLRQHGDTDTCAWCGDTIIWDTEDNQIGDWRLADGDYGCNSAPVPEDEEGVAGHRTTEEIRSIVVGYEQMMDTIHLTRYFNKSE